MELSSSPIHAEPISPQDQAQSMSTDTFSLWAFIKVFYPATPRAVFLRATPPSDPPGIP